MRIFMCVCCVVKMHISIFVVATRLCFKHLLSSSLFLSPSSSVMSLELHVLHECFGMILRMLFTQFTNNKRQLDILLIMCIAHTHIGLDAFSWC